MTTQMLSSVKMLVRTVSSEVCVGLVLGLCELSRGGEACGGEVRPVGGGGECWR